MSLAPLSLQNNTYTTRANPFDCVSKLECSKEQPYLQKNILNGHHGKQVKVVEPNTMQGTENLLIPWQI